MSCNYTPGQSSSLIGKRLCKAFASRSFWASVVSAYKIDKKNFYKIHFDDGDVDILSEGEVLADIAKVCLHRIAHCVCTFRHDMIGKRNTKRKLCTRIKRWSINSPMRSAAISEKKPQ